MTGHDEGTREDKEEERWRTVGGRVTVGRRDSRDMETRKRRGGRSGSREPGRGDQEDRERSRGG